MLQKMCGYTIGKTKPRIFQNFYPILKKFPGFFFSSGTRPLFICMAASSTKPDTLRRLSPGYCIRVHKGEATASAPASERAMHVHRRMSRVGGACIFLFLKSFFCVNLRLHLILRTITQMYAIPGSSTIVR